MLMLFVLLTSCLAGVVQGDVISTDYERYNSGQLGHRPHQDFVSSDEFAPMLQVNVWNKEAISQRGSHIFLRHDGNETSPLASPLVLDANDLSAVYMNRSFENVFGTRVQEDRGKKYLTFWEGQKGDGVGDGWGLAYDDQYRLAYNISAHNISAHADLHEFAFTGHGTALVTGIDKVVVDTAQWKDHGFRGRSKLPVLNAVFQEIDLETNEVLFSWKALDHIDPLDSYERWTTGWDIYHMNSVQKVCSCCPLSLLCAGRSSPLTNPTLRVQTEAGNYLISIRHTHSIHLINGTSGDIIWTLGGKRNQFEELEPDFEANAPLLQFSWQHHPRYLPGTNEKEMTFFDNHGKSTSHGECKGSCSRGVHIAIDDTVSPPTVKLLHEYTHPAHLRAQSQGSVQPLMTATNEVDNVFVGWGRCPSFTEHTPAGDVVMNVQFSPWHSKDVPDALDNYRAYKMDWKATPWWNPSMALRPHDVGNRLDVYVSWNGATEVREWVVRGGPNGKVLAKSPRTGFETVMTIRPTKGMQEVWAEALDASGKKIGSTDVVDPTYSDDVAAAGEWDEDEDEDGETTSDSVNAGSQSISEAAGWQDEVGKEVSDDDSNVGILFALVAGGVAGFALVISGAVVAWRRYRVYDRLECEDGDNDDEEFEVDGAYGEQHGLLVPPAAEAWRWKEGRFGVGGGT